MITIFLSTFHGTVETTTFCGLYNFNLSSDRKSINGFFIFKMKKTFVKTVFDIVS